MTKALLSLGLWASLLPATQAANPEVLQSLLSHPVLEPEVSLAEVQSFTEQGIQRHRDFAMQPVSTLVLGQKASRPLRAGMSTRKLERLNLPPTEFSVSIRDMMRRQTEWFSTGNDSA